MSEYTTILRTDIGGNKSESLSKGPDIFVWIPENLVCMPRLLRDILVKNESVKSVDTCNETLKDIVSDLPPDKQILQTFSQFTNMFYEDNQLLSDVDL